MSIIGSLPFTLTNGSTADATQVMADFNSIIADVNGGAAENGANSSITQLTGLTTPLAVSEGGTGSVGPFTLNSVVLGNAAGAFQAGPAPGTSGNLLQSNGVAWTSSAVLLGSYSYGVDVTVPPGAGIHSPAAGTLCLATSGADQLCVGPSGGGYMIGATGTDKGAGSFNAQKLFVNGNSLGDGSVSAAASGWVDLPGGIIIQWGIFQSNGSVGSVQVNFPKAFPNNCFGVQQTVQNQQTMTVNTTSVANGSFQSIGNVAGNPNVYYMAIGN